MAKDAPIKTLKLDDITINGGTQSRTELNNAAVDEYRELMQEGTEFPPVVVYYDGTTYWLADGFHRFHASRHAKLLKIKAEVREGSQRDAILHAVGANAGHGIRRTNEDKRKAVTILLNDPEWSQWSDRKIAEMAAVNHVTVAKWRGQLVNFTSCETPEAEPVKRMGADGKARKLPERKQLAPEPWDAPAPEFEPEPERAPLPEPDQTPDEPKGAVSSYFAEWCKLVPRLTTHRYFRTCPFFELPASVNKANPTCDDITSRLNPLPLHLMRQSFDVGGVVATVHGGQLERSRNCC